MNVRYNPPAHLSRKFLNDHPSVSSSSLFAYLLVLKWRLPTSEQKSNFQGDLFAILEKYKDIVKEKTMVLLESKSQNRLTGQWSMDVMLSGEDFYIIDMALAEESYYYQSVPLEDRRVSKQNWIPKLS